MADQPLILCDTNIFVEVYRGNKTMVTELRSIGQNNIALSAVTAAELLFGARDKKELAAIDKDIAKLYLFPISEEISGIALSLVTQYALSHRLAIPDALIAATALHHDLPLYTLNLKDFKYISGLHLYNV